MDLDLDDTVPVGITGREIVVHHRFVHATPISGGDPVSAAG
jgi:hypothetical protein